MIAGFIFLMLFLTLLAMHFKKPLLTISLFVISLVLIMLLFSHHVTDALNISL